MANETELERMVVRLIGDGSSYQKMLSEASKQTEKFTRDVPAALGQIEQTLKQVGTKISLYISAPLAGISAVARSEAGKFEGALAQIVGLVGLSKETVADFRKEILALAPAVGKFPTELAEAMFFITSAGLRGETAFEALSASAKAASSGLGGTVSVADAVTSAMNAYGHENLSATRATELLTAAVRAGKAEASQFAPQLGQLLPLTASMGIEFDQVAAALAFLTKTTGNASLAATGLKGILRVLVGGSKESIKNFEMMGFTLDKLQEKARLEGIPSVLREIRAAAEAAGLRLNELFTDSEGLTAALQFTGAAAADAQQVFEDVAASVGILDDAFAAVADTAGFKTQQAMAQTKALFIDIGDRIAPLFSKLRSVSMDLLGIWDKLPEPLKMLGVAAIVAGAGLGPLVLLLGSLVAASAQVIKAVVFIQTTYTGWAKKSIETAATVSTSSAVSTAAVQSQATTTAAAATKIVAAYTAIALAATASAKAIATSQLVRAPRGLTPTEPFIPPVYMKPLGPKGYLPGPNVIDTTAVKEGSKQVGKLQQMLSALSTVMTRFVVPAFRLLGPVIRFATNPVVALITAIGLLEAKFSPLRNLLGIISRAFSELLTSPIGEFFKGLGVIITEAFSSLIKWVDRAVKKLANWVIPEPVREAFAAATGWAAEFFSRFDPTAISDFNKEMERSAELAQKLLSINESRFTRELEKIKTTTNELVRNRMFENLMSSTTAALKQNAGEILKLQDKIKTEYGAMDRTFGNKFLEADKQQLKELEDRSAQLREQIKLLQQTKEDFKSLKPSMGFAESAADYLEAGLAVPKYLQPSFDLKPNQEMIAKLQQQVKYLGLSEQENQILQLRRQHLVAVQAGNLQVADAIEKQILTVQRLQDQISRRDAKEAAKQLIKSLEEQRKTLGMTGAELDIYRLRQQNHTEATIEMVKAAHASLEAERKKMSLLEEGKRLTEKYLTPQEKLAKEQERLSSLLNAGAISVAIYDKALKEAQSLFSGDAGSIDISLNINPEAAVEGSVEAFKAIRRMMQRENELDPIIPVLAEEGLQGAEVIAASVPTAQTAPQLDVPSIDDLNQFSSAVKQSKPPEVVQEAPDQGQPGGKELTSSFNSGTGRIVDKLVEVIYAIEGSKPVLVSAGSV